MSGSRFVALITKYQDVGLRGRCRRKGRKRGISRFKGGGKIRGQSDSTEGSIPCIPWGPSHSLPGVISES